MPEPKNKKIGDHVFPISQPYEEGHVLTAIEAKVLNQVRAENIGNNVRKKVQELLAEGRTAEAEALVAEKDREYQFTEAATGGSSRTMDPIEKEARKIARDAIKAALAAKGQKLSDIDKERLDEAIAKAAQREDILAAAKKAVTQREKTIAAAAEGLGIGA